MLSSKDKILDISVNLARVSEWILSDSKSGRVDQFLKETKYSLQSIDSEQVPPDFKPTLKSFRQEFKKLLKDKRTEKKEEWAEIALTWANILQHRSSLL